MHFGDCADILLVRRKALTCLTCHLLSILCITCQSPGYWATKRIYFLWCVKSQNVLSCGLMFTTTLLMAYLIYIFPAIISISQFFMWESDRVYNVITDFLKILRNNQYIGRPSLIPRFSLTHCCLYRRMSYILNTFCVLIGLHLLALRQACRRALTPVALLRFLACP